jgi:16S rRNA processing protein RimM
VLTPPPGWLIVAELGRPHGIRGQATAVLAGVSAEVLAALSDVRLAREDGAERRTRVVRALPRGGGVILELEGVTDRDAAEEWRGAVLIARREELPAAASGEWYVADLVGLAVFADDGRELGVLEDVWKMPANDVLVVRGAGGGEVLLPVTHEVVRSVDPVERRVVVHLLPGLLDEPPGA